MNQYIPRYSITGSTLKLSTSSLSMLEISYVRMLRNVGEWQIHLVFGKEKRQGVAHKQLKMVNNLIRYHSHGTRFQDKSFRRSPYFQLLTSNNFFFFFLILFFLIFNF